VSRARVVTAAVTVAVLATQVQAQAVPVPPSGWTPAAGLLIVILLAVTSACAIRHHRNHRTAITPEGEGALT
jgi:hypothetical protein